MGDSEFYDLLADIENGREIDPEKRKQVNEKMDTLMCCNGYMCGCHAATFRDEFEHYFEKRDQTGYQRYLENDRII